MIKFTMANQLLQAGDLEQAEALYLQLRADDPCDIRAILSLSKLYERQGKHDKVVEFLRKAIELDPANADTHLKLARHFMLHEQFEQASKYYRQVLKLQPRHIGSLIALANMTRQSAYSDHIRAMENLYRHPELPVNERRRLSFALGKVFDDLCEYDKAFYFYQQGNLIAREAYRRPTEVKIRRLQKNIINNFDANFFQRYRNAGISDDSPIIFFGMPRSGTTLVEQILASHPDVYGAGEVQYLIHIIQELEKKLGTRFPIGFNELESQILCDMATQYVSELKRPVGEESYITDKSLGSIPYLGLISVMLPKAKLIHCRRDPRDQGLSFFQKDFGAQQVFSYDLEDIGRHYKRTQDMMDYWNCMLPGRIVEIQYEDLVSDLEGNVRKLLENCGLPFDEACLSFYETDRVVGTASHMQVRRPLYTSSVGRWKNYEQHLQPLIAVLDM